MFGDLFVGKIVVWLRSRDLRFVFDGFDVICAIVRLFCYESWGFLYVIQMKFVYPCEHENM